MSDNNKPEALEACGQKTGCPLLSESMVDQIAERAAERAIENLTAHVYQEVGKGVISKMTWLVGAIAVGLYIYLKSQGILK